MRGFCNNFKKYRGNNILDENIILSKGGNVKGGEKEAIIYLIGKKDGESESSIYKNLKIVISDGEDGKNTEVLIKNIEGYNPKIYVVNFTDNEYKEILFTIENKNESEGIYSSVIGYDGSKFIEFFNSKNFEYDHSCKVIYDNFYKIKLIEENEKKYFIDISNKPKQNLNNIYTEKGKLKYKIEETVSKISGVYPMLSKNGDNFDLCITKDIIGQYNLGYFGKIIYILKYNSNKFKEITNCLAIYTEESLEVSRTEKKNIIKEISTHRVNIDFSEVDFIESERFRSLRVERALEKEFELKGDRDKVNYLYNKYDLNDDKKEEVIVYLEGPLFCTSEGNTIVVLEEKGSEYRVISKINITRNPIIISENKTNGYRDIIVKVINGEKEVFKVLEYNGNSYPSNINNSRNLKNGEKIKGIAVVSDDLFYKRGLEYK
ncbi:hypothetical protein JCM1393_26080 [Clostridium carnis]